MQELEGSVLFVAGLVSLLFESETFLFSVTECLHIVESFKADLLSGAVLMESLIAYASYFL